MTDKKGCVYLVGAGCGNADLITVRGLSLLKNCDALVYDDLIDEDLLINVPMHTELFYMGKRSGHHSFRQEEICNKLISLAQEGKTVVRLKGGDPFVFGRGGEEVLALTEAGIRCEVVPGISSAIAIPAMAGIPVTHRKISRSFHVITGHTADTETAFPDNLNALAALSGTLVFLMGLQHISKIATGLMAAGKARTEAVAVISGGNAPYPSVVRGTLGDIADKARDIRPPAVIVVGETAALDFSSEPLPLSGVSVGLVGTAVVTDKLAAKLKVLGATVFKALNFLVEDLPFNFDLNRLYKPGKRWVIFTSANGVHSFFRRFKEQKEDIRRLNNCRFAVIGTATGTALSQYGIQPDFCPSTFTCAVLGEELIPLISADTEVFFFRSVHGSKELYTLLEKHCRVEDVPLYELRPDRRVLKRTTDRLSTANYLTFASASGVEAFWDLYSNVPDNITCVCIGEVTASALQKKYNKPFLLSQTISVDGIIKAIINDTAKELYL